MVVVPALNTRLRYWMSDLDHARLAAQWRLMRSLDALRDAGVAAEGCIGDADPFLAMRDILAVFPADEIVIATHPERRSNWLARDLPGARSSRVPAARSPHRRRDRRRRAHARRGLRLGPVFSPRRSGRSSRCASRRRARRRRR